MLVFGLSWAVGLENHSRPNLFRRIDLGEDDSVSGACFCVCVCVCRMKIGVEWRH